MTKMVMKWMPFGLAFLAMGCSSGSSTSSELAAGRYQLAFSMDTSAADAPVNGVDLTVMLPAGVQVASAADGTGRIPGTALSAGSAVREAGLIVGQYESGSRRLHLSLTTPSTTSWSGEFARLTVEIPTGTTLTESALLKAAGESLPGYQVVGLAASTRSTAVLTERVKTTVALVR